MNDGNLWEFIVKDLTAENKQSAVEAITHKLFNQFNAFPEHYIWFCKNGMQGRFAELYQNIDPSILFCRLIELLDNMGFKIQKGRNGNLKTISNKIKNLLEDKGVAYATSIVNDGNAESIFDIISSSKCLEDWFKVAVENLVVTDSRIYSKCRDSPRLMTAKSTLLRLVTKNGKRSLTTL